MLSRALNRGAPQGHFAAYIQPDEAALLRAHGGGVPPGGGQYMANGIPAYIADPGIDIGAYGGSVGQSLSPTVSPIGGGFGPGQGMEAAAARAARANARINSWDAQQSQALQTRAFTEASGEMPSSAAELTPAFMPGTTQTTDSSASDPAPTSTQDANLARIMANPDFVNPDGTVTEAGRDAVAQNISEGGLGWLSPGSSLAQNNPDATIGQIASVNASDPSTGGYAIFNPNPQLGTGVNLDSFSVPEGMRMGVIGNGIIPAGMATAIGALTPGLGGLATNLGIMGSGFPTLGGMIMDSPAVQDSALGNILALPGEARAEITGLFGDAFSPVTDALGGGVGVASDIAANIGNQIAGITPDSLSHGPPVSTPEGFSGVEVPAPLVPEVVTTDPTDEEPFVRDDTPPREYADLSDAIAGRLQENLSTGYQAIAQSPAGLPEGSFNPSLSQYQEGYYVENPVGSGQYHAVGPPGTSTVAMIFNRDQIPEGSLIAPPGTQYADVFGVQPSQTYEKVGLA